MAAAFLDARTRPPDGGLGTYDVECFREERPEHIDLLRPPDPAHGTFDVQNFAETLGVFFILPASSISGTLPGTGSLSATLSSSTEVTPEAAVPTANPGRYQSPKRWVVIHRVRRR